MSDAAKARAEARRKAILARGGDRLARITTSARGEDGASYMNDVSPLPNRTDLTNFVGETSELPTPLASTPSSRNVSSASMHTSPFQAAGLGSAPPDPSVWSQEQQQEFMNALLGAAASGGLSGAGPHTGPRQPRQRVSSTSSSSTAVASSVTASSVPLPADGPMSALMAALQQGGAGAPPGFQTGTNTQTSNPKAKTLSQKLMPVIHMLSAWLLLAYFVLFREPEKYEARTHGATLEVTWKRWAELGWKNPDDGWSVQAVPFFWAFTTVALVLHTWRIFTKLDPIQPPMLLALALPHLPPPLPTIITNGLKYLQIGGVFLDDISALLVGTGFLIWTANWIAG